MKRKSQSVEGYKKALEFVIFLLLFITGSFIALIIKANLFTYNLIVLLPPVLYLLYLNKAKGKKVLIEGIFAGFVGEILFDRFAHSSRAWFSPSIFEFRPLGLPFENLIWCLLYVTMAFAFYEYFFDTSKAKKLNSSHRNWIIIGVVFIFLIPILYTLFPNIFVIPYFYFVAVIVLLLADIFVFTKYPKIAIKTLIASLVVFPLGFVHEFVSLELEHWIFETGFHIGYLNLFGYSIPFEEIAFYIVAPMALMSLYELLIDNKKA